MRLGMNVLGIAAVMLGVFFLLAGLHRYFTVQSALLKGQFLVARGIIVGTVFGMGAFVVLVLGVVLTVT